MFKLIPMLFPENNDPRHNNVSEAEINFTGISAALKQMGFKPLTRKAAKTLVGKQVIFGTPNTCGYKLFVRTIAKVDKKTGMEFEHKPVPVRQLSEAAKFDSGLQHDILCVTAYQKHLYLVISDKPITTSEGAKTAGFKQLSEVSPSDLPLGTLVLIRNKNNGTIFPAIVRVMGKSTDEDLVLLYWSLSSIVAGQWQTDRMVNNKNQFRQYEILVLS
jgi:hypothetical protein